mgnify:CR=1 FL=1
MILYIADFKAVSADRALPECRTALPARDGATSWRLAGGEPAAWRGMRAAAAHGAVAAALRACFLLPHTLPCPPPPPTRPPATQIRGKVSAVIDGLWFIFWLSAAAVATDIVANGGSNSRLNASCAFAWITW